MLKYHYKGKSNVHVRAVVPHLAACWNDLENFLLLKKIFFPKSHRDRVLPSAGSIPKCLQ